MVCRTGVTTCQAKPTSSAAITTGARSRCGARASTSASSTGPPNSDPSRVMLPPSGFGATAASVASAR